ncbi:MAG: hypothetical protein JO033_27920 [Acidobacteriaceae bacterium]|nr:hypothetical protein [Acidobacteriaceae bacterium]
MKLVDLGGCDLTGGFERGDARAVWAHWQDSRQWRITQTPNRIVLIEGQPDRWPRADERVENWLEGRYGSFRGFEITFDDVARRSTVRVFVDPLCTRPVYYLVTSNCVCISDKLSTVVLNSDGAAQPDWAGLLEAAALGSLYSHQTTVRGAVWLMPGEGVAFESGKRVQQWINALPSDASLTHDEVTARPAETLRFALEKAISETWTDPETHLLLSGGLDSRIVLALARGKRKALTFEMYSNEAIVTEQVAEAAGAELRVAPPPDYEFPMRWSYLATGAMHDSKFVTHLGLVAHWRKRGIGGVTHGYFHNTVYRGWAAGKVERYPNRGSMLFEWMGRNGYYFDRYGCKQPYYPQILYGLLSAEGKQVLRCQLRELSESIKPVIINGYDLTFERRLLAFVSRQIFFCVMLSWYEGVDVASAVFQPALWTWYALSQPHHRDCDWAIREVYLNLDHPVASLPDSNTGHSITHLPVHWRDRVRNQFWYAPLRVLYKTTFRKPQPYQESGFGWGNRFRGNPRIMAALEDGIGVLRGNPLFDNANVQLALDAYRAGDNQMIDPICALMAVGQWQRLISDPGSLSQHLEVFDSGLRVRFL